MNRALKSLIILLVVSVSVFAKTTQVGTARALQNLNACAKTDTIVITNDIDMSGRSFSPMCENGFYGVFDGNGHKISNLTISEYMPSCNNIAFIAVLADGGVLRNLTFESPHIEAYEIFGWVTVKGVSVSVAVGELQGGFVENIHVNGGNITIGRDWNGSSIDAGGIVGTAETGTISECDGDVDFSNSARGTVYIGGICGSATGDVTLTSVTYTGNADALIGFGGGDVTSVTKYGAVTIIERNSAKSAVIDGAYTGADTIKFTSNIIVNSVEYTRTFTPNTMSTVMLPFSIDTAKVEGGVFYRFKRVDVNEETGAWKVFVGKIKTEQLGANTPYMVLPSATQLTFNGPVTFNTNTAPLENPYGLEEGSSWEYKGVYAHTEFDNVVEDGPMYAFAGQAKDGVKVGQFTEIGANVRSYPMQAYLVNHQGNGLSKSARGFGHSLVLPNFVDVEIEDENGLVVQSGRLNTVTGDVRMDRWFDLKGRKLNAKPTAKGTYYNNGKRVVIK